MVGVPPNVTLGVRTTDKKNRAYSEARDPESLRVWCQSIPRSLAEIGRVQG